MPGSQASGKVVWGDPCTEVSQTAVSELTNMACPAKSGKPYTEAIRPDEVTHHAEVPSPEKG